MVKIPPAFGFAGCSEIPCIDITDKNGAFGLSPVTMGFANLISVVHMAQ
jgi:hypothetical protein